MEDGTVRESLAGTPQGGVISPLLANIYLDVLDWAWERDCKQVGLLTRYADDFVIMCKTESQAKEARRQVERILASLSLKLHPEKTRLVDLRRGKEGFTFLGHTVRKRSRERLHELGLYRLQGKVSYPVQAAPVRPSLSRVREIRTHGLKGGFGIGLN